MPMELLKDFLLWCLVTNYAILLIWFSAFFFGRAWLFKLHTNWFKLAPERFDAAHYNGMAIYKIGIFLFNLAPFSAAYFMTNGG